MTHYDNFAFSTAFCLQSASRAFVPPFALLGASAATFWRSQLVATTLTLFSCLFLFYKPAGSSYDEPVLCPPWALCSMQTPALCAKGSKTVCFLAPPTCICSDVFQTTSMTSKVKNMMHRNSVDSVTTCAARKLNCRI